ncbi:hypothetical protein DEIPH_ctg052orf0049 [Deinococcus phoenicis]|uniref:Imm-5-like domain-containing protein n=1 Tax=Deinococcus phoenicis TaxID=1476583 RepID=A0A016QM66_9DEIO|nr:hypothetical protein [Deinococcus phoenicis]EYB67051.1 hypothetical protein DEIPH_ctg052orf0049 [Deinococcus phoenicis]
MSGLSPLIAEAHARLLATPPALTADLRVTVGQVVAQKRTEKNPDGKLCREGVASALRKLKVRQSDTEHVVTLDRAMEVLALEDVLRVIDACHPDGQRVLRLFAADCAEMVLPLYERDYPNDDRPRKAIEAARGHVLGVVTAEELAAAWGAAWGAAGAAAGDAAWDAAWDAARAAAGDACGQLLRRYHTQSVATEGGPQ